MSYLYVYVIISTVLIYLKYTRIGKFVTAYWKKNSLKTPCIVIMSNSHISSYPFGEMFVIVLFLVIFSFIKISFARL